MKLVFMVICLTHLLRKVIDLSNRPSCDVDPFLVFNIRQTKTQERESLVWINSSRPCPLSRCTPWEMAECLHAQVLKVISELVKSTQFVFKKSLGCSSLQLEISGVMMTEDISWCFLCFWGQKPYKKPHNVWQPSSRITLCQRADGQFI